MAAKTDDLIEQTEEVAVVEEAAPVGYLARSAYTKRILTILDTLRKTGGVPILWGEPGTGKTALVKALVDRARHENSWDEHQYPFRLILGSTMDPTDVSGLPMKAEAPVRKDGAVVIDQATGLPTNRTVTVNAVPEWAAALSDAGRGMLFLDEASSASPATQAAELSLVQGRQVGNSGETLPEEVFIILAANPADIAADGWTLAAPMANRLCHIDWDPPVTDWLTGMIVAWGKKVSDREFTERAQIAAYLRKFPDLVQSRPEVEEEAGKAWPSRRSWDNAVVALAHLNDEETRLELLTGYVGEAAARQFTVWARDLDLPETADVVENPERFPWSDYPPEKAYAILAAVVAFSTPDTYTKSCDVFATAAANGPKDVPAALAVEMLNRPRKKDTKFPSHVVKAFSDTLREAGLIG